MSVKPQQFGTLIEEIKNDVTAKHIIISTITGVTHKDIESVLGTIPMLRIMPNIALEICESMTCISFRNTEPKQEERILSIFDKMGKTLIIPEDMMGAATVVGALRYCFRSAFYAVPCRKGALK